MPASKLLDRPIQLRKTEDDEEYFSSSSDEAQDAVDSSTSARSSQQDDEDSSLSGGDDERVESEEDNDQTSGDDETAQESLRDISFGALAKAQESLGQPSRKRKSTQPGNEIQGSGRLRNGDAEDNDDNDLDHQQTATKRLKTSPLGNNSNNNHQHHEIQTRTSKHAPTILSSRKAVSRKRAVFSPPTNQKFRDPRFDPTVLASSNDAGSRNKANKNYSFLTEYQAQEMLDLKQRIKKSKTDPAEVDRLKRQVMSIESKLKSAEARQVESQILKKHNEAEREAIRTGKKSKPFYLKDSQVRKMVKEEKLAGMGKKARDKAEERKRKREKGKEARHMPRERRT